MKVLFVCLGNICRSPLAEAIFKGLLRDTGISAEWEVDSAATSRYELGCRPDHRGLKVMRNKGLSSDHIARQLCHDDYHRFDYILCMDESNLSDIKRMAPRGVQYKAQIQLLGTYDSEGSDIIEDPYYGDQRDFELVYEQCLKACKGFLEHVHK